MKAFLTAGLGFGDCGKGKIVSALTQKYNAGVVVRYNGGAQAAHNVVTDDGIHHTFAQFGSGTFNEGTKTFLGCRVLVNPLTMAYEASELESKGINNPLDRMYIDQRCIITSPFHMSLNRLREISRGAAKHGSCGMGIGECVAESLEEPSNTLLLRDFLNPDLLKVKLLNQRQRAQNQAQSFDHLLDKENPNVNTECFMLHDESVTFQVIDRYLKWFKQIHMVQDGGKALLSNETIIFEGAQGALLHESFGFPPYNTWTDTSFNHALKILKEIEYTGETERIGIMRSYMTRHGAGPFVSESQELNQEFKESHNHNNDWQDNMRFGYLDLQAFKFSMGILGGIDYIALTHTDILNSKSEWPICYEYKQGETFWNLLKEFNAGVNCTDKALDSSPVTQIIPTAQIQAFIAENLDAPVKITSFGAKISETDFH